MEEERSAVGACYALIDYLLDVKDVPDQVRVRLLEAVREIMHYAEEDSVTKEAAA